MIRLFFTLLLLTQPLAYADNPIKIGATLGLSGNVARYGEWGERGISIAIDEMNSSNGQQIKVFFEDHAGSPAKAVSAYQKLRKLNNVQYVLTMQSSIALALAPLSNRENVVQMDFSATTPAYSSPNDFTFRTGVVATQLAIDAAKILAEQLDVKRVACLYIENDFGEGMFQLFQKHFPGEITVAESFKSDESDYRPQLLRIKKSGVTDLWLVGHLRESGLIVKQAHDLGMKIKIYSDVYSIEGPDFLTAAGSAANSIIYLAPHFDPDGGNSVANSFADRYREKYKEDPTYFAAQAYDAVTTLAKAFQQCKEVTPDCVKNTLYNISFQGASGYVDFDQNGDLKKKIALKQVKNGGFVEFPG